MAPAIASSTDKGSAPEIESLHLLKCPKLWSFVPTETLGRAHSELCSSPLNSLVVSSPPCACLGWALLPRQAETAGDSKNRASCISPSFASCKQDARLLPVYLKVIPPLSPPVALCCCKHFARREGTGKRRHLCSASAELCSNSSGSAFLCSMGRLGQRWEPCSQL